jgi:hypothetical protein
MVSPTARRASSSTFSGSNAGLQLSGSTLGLDEHGIAGLTVDRDVQAPRSRVARPAADQMPPLRASKGSPAALGSNVRKGHRLGAEIAVKPLWARGRMSVKELEAWWSQAGSNR